MKTRRQYGVAPYALPHLGPNPPSVCRLPEEPGPCEESAVRSMPRMLIAVDAAVIGIADRKKSVEPRSDAGNEKAVAAVKV